MIEQTPKTPPEQIQPEANPVDKKPCCQPRTILLVILGLLVVAGAVYAAFEMGKKQTQPNLVAEPTVTPQTTEVTSTSDPTANWQTYTNTQYRYSVKYPTDFSVVETSPDYVRFSPGPNDPNLPQSETYLSIQLDKSSQTQPEFVYKKTTDGKTLRISQIFMDVDENQKPQIKAIFDQILSTFKFTDPITTTDPTANWKTYTKSSKDFGSFAIKYPSNWIIAEKQTQDPKNDQVIVTISKDDYKIEINAFINGWSAGGCNFDKTTKNKAMFSDYDSYVVISNSSIEFRRALPPADYENSLAWSICGKESSSNVYTTALPFSGAITYFTPTNFSETVLKEMDQILSTFKFTN